MARDDFNPSKAFGAVSDRIKAHPLFGECKVEILENSVNTLYAQYKLHGKLVTRISDMIEAEIRCLRDHEGVSENMGSKMFPLSVYDCLKQDVPSMREEVQFRLFKLCNPSGKV